MSHFLGLSDAQLAQIEPHVPKKAVGRPLRADDPPAKPDYGFYLPNPRLAKPLISYVDCL